MITLDQVKIIKEKKKDNPDQINLFGDNSGKKKKYTPPSKEKSDAIQARSANRDAKKYASGEYPKIGGGERISPKSKGPGASTGGTKIPPATVGGKSKGTTPVNVNITKPQKGVDAKVITKKYNEKNKNRKEFEYAKSKESKTFKGTVTQGANKGRSYTITRNPPPKGIDKNLNKAEVKLRDAKSGRNMKTGRLSPISQDLGKRAARGEPKAVQFTIDQRKDYRRGRGLGKRAERKFDASGGKKTGTLRKGNLSFPGDRTGAYSRAKNQLDFDKALKKARGGTKGDIAPEAPKSVKDYAKGVRDKRIKKLKLPDTSFSAKTKFSQKDFEKSLGGAKKSTTAAPGLFGKGITKGQANVKDLQKSSFKITQPKDITLPKSFTDFSKKIKKYRVDRDIDKKIANPNLDISKEIKQRKINKKFVGQQNIPGLDTTPKKSSRVIKKKIVKTPKNIQKSIPGLKGVTDTPVRTTPKGGPLVTTSKGIDPEVVQGRFSSNKELKDQEKKIRDALNKAREQGRAAGGGSGKPPKGPKVTTGGSGPFGMRPSDKMSGINPKAKVGLGKKVLRYIKKKPGKAALIGAAAVGTGLFVADRIKKAMSGPTLTKKDFTKTAPIQNRQGEKVTFKYARKSDNDKIKDKASPYLTSDALKKFKAGDYKVSTKSTPTKKGTPINVNQNIKNSAFEKQLKRLEKNPEKNKKFLSTVKNATRPT